MGTPYLGEIRVTSFAFAPKGWARCDGQLLPINQNQALFAILGTTYGGNGQTNFALPDLRGRSAAHFGNDLSLGQRGGAETVTVTPSQMAAHTHTLAAQNALSTSADPAGNTFGKKPFGGRDIFAAPGNPTPLDAASLKPAGGSQPHDNMQPFGTLNFVIALQGIFPSRN